MRGALVVGRDRATGTVWFHPAYLTFCRDWDVQPRACAPYRARTKGKVESGVKYVKRNALAGRTFSSFAALEAHLTEWIQEADTRVPGRRTSGRSIGFAGLSRRRSARCRFTRCRVFATSRPRRSHFPQTNTPQPVRWIVFPRYTERAGTELQPLTRPAALRRLLDESFVPLEQLDRGKVESRVQWMRTVECFELPLSSLDEAVPILRELMVRRGSA